MDIDDYVLVRCDESGHVPFIVTGVSDRGANRWHTIKEINETDSLKILSISLCMRKWKDAHLVKLDSIEPTYLYRRGRLNVLENIALHEIHPTWEYSISNVHRNGKQFKTKKYEPDTSGILFDTSVIQDNEYIEHKNKLLLAYQRITQLIQDNRFIEYDDDAFTQTFNVLEVEVIASSKIIVDHEIDFIKRQIKKASIF